MHSLQRGVTRHPAVSAALLHGAFALAFAFAVCLATQFDLPRMIAPALVAVSTIASVTVMLAAVLSVRRVDAEDRVVADHHHDRACGSCGAREHPGAAR